MLTFDYTHMMSDVIGDRCGVTEAELESFSGPVAKIDEQLRAAHGKGELPFYDLPFQEDVKAIVEIADDLAARFDNLLVLGIGGSALGTTAVATALRPVHWNLLSSEQRAGRPRLFVLDNVDPAGIDGTLSLLEPERTCFCVISKSGTTVETMSQFLFAREWIKKAVGDKYKDHFVMITDPETGVLRQLVEAEGYLSCSVPPGVGGRFSVFTAVGLLPLAAAGVDIAKLLAGAAAINPQLRSSDLFGNPAYLNGVLQYIAFGKGMPISVMMPYSDQLRDVADWYSQLWAESLGKKLSLNGQTVHTGPTPVKALGATDQHSQLQLYMEGPFDKVVTFLTADGMADTRIPGAPDIPELDYLDGQRFADLLANEQRATAVALARAGRPNCTIRLKDVGPQTVGALLFLFEVQTVFAGALFGVDPLDQPGVEAGKKLTYGFMRRAGFEAFRREVEDWEKLIKTRSLIIQ